MCKYEFEKCWMSKRANLDSSVHQTAEMQIRPGFVQKCNDDAHTHTHFLRHFSSWSKAVLAVVSRATVTHFQMCVTHALEDQKKKKKIWIMETLTSYAQ